MSHDTEDKLFDLLDEWALLHKQGKDVLVQELCRDCPELVEELQRRIETLKATDWLDQPLDEDDEPYIDRTKPTDFGLPDHLGRYRLDELIGAGGFGQVWRGFDPELHRAVAIKIPRPDRVSTPERVERFVEEARRVAQLKHTGIVPIYDVGRDGERCYIVSDLIEGRNLAEVIADNRPSQADACRMVAEVARILDYAHVLGFIHRDVKPANILLDDQGKVFLTDFGIAATVEELSHPTSSTGTLPYMSPEQIAGEPVDSRTDVYSLGIVLVELLTGKRLSTGDSIRSKEAVAVPHLETTPIPAELKAICRKCLAPNRDDRFEKSGDLAKALDSLSDKKSRVGLWIVGASVVLLVVLTAALWLHRLWSTDPNGSPSAEEIARYRDDSAEARWILQVGGSIRLLKPARDVEAVEDLPIGKLTITGINLSSSRGVTNDDMARLAALEHVTNLNLNGTSIGDEGLQHISGLTSLRSLSLWRTMVTDKGLEALSGMNDLTTLNLSASQVSDGAVERLAHMQQLHRLDIAAESLTDEGLRSLPKLSSLRTLSAGGTQITDMSLQVFAQLPRLRSVGVAKTAITEAAIQQFEKSNPLVEVQR